MRTFLSRRVLGTGLLIAAVLLLLPTRANTQEIACPPEPGSQITQTSASTAKVLLDLPGILEIPETINLAGDVTTVAVVAPVGGTVQTEIVSMSLTGDHPQLGRVTLKQSSDPERRSIGSLRGPDEDCFYIDSFFDVFFEITVEVPAGVPTLHNEQPLRVLGEGPVPLDHTKGGFQFVQSPDTPPVPLLDPNSRPVGSISNVVHGIDPPPPDFKRGDCNCDGCVDDLDVTCIQDLVVGIGQTCCEDAADANDDGRIDIADSVFLAQYLAVAGAPPPPAPGPDDCGPDPTTDRLRPCNYPPEACDVDCEEGCFPPAGIDVMNSNLFHDIDVVGIGLIRGNLSGPIRVQRSDPYVDPATGLQCIDTELISMQLTGTDPVAGTINITLDPCRKSEGRICELVAGTCFPAESFFDVYVRIELPDLGMCLYACQPAKMRTVIDRIPPFRNLYNLDIGDGNAVPLYKGPCMDDCDPALDPCTQDPLPPPDAYILKAVHEPVPPDDCDCFPEAGQDVINTTLGHQIILPGLNINCSNFTGPIVVQRSDPHLDADGHCVIDTEIVRMEMAGICDGNPAVIRLNPDRPSKGFIRALSPETCYPAESCFNIFFELEISTPLGPLKFRNCTPAIMCCEINDLPPLGCPYALRNAPIPLYQVVPGAPSPCLQKPLPNPAGFLEEGVHIPEDVPDPCCPEYGPGVDIFDSNLLHDIDIPGIGTATANLRGPVKVVRGTPYVNPLTGLCCVDVEMVEMQLRGNEPDFGEILVTLDPRRASRGRICEITAGTCFPARSCFEMYVRVELPDLGLVLVACDPAIMCCEINSIPPYGCLYNLEIGAGDVIPLYEELATTSVCDVVPPPNPRAFIVKAVHEPEDPCDTYPPAGDDTMDSELAHRIRIFGLGPDDPDLICDADMRGPVVVRRSDPRVDPATGSCTIDTEIVQMELTGNDPVCGEVIFRLNPDKPSLGEIRQLDPGNDFPAESFFDVFVEVEIPNEGLVLRNCAPVRMERVINAIPPINQFYILRGLVDVPLYRAADCAALPDPALPPVGVIEAAQHAPREPCDCPELGPGIDVMDSVLRHDIVLFGLGDQLCQAPLRGQVVVERGAPYAQTLPDGTVVCCVSTRVREMSLVGDDPLCGPIEIRLSPDRASRGTICALSPDTCLPALSCFDMYIEVVVQGLVLVNCEPVRMCCEISTLPPYGCVYRFDPGTVVSLFEKGECDVVTHVPIPAGEIRLAEHTPVPCAPLNVECRLDPATGQVTVTWEDDPDCPCERYIVTRTNPDGTEVDIPVEPGANQVVDTIECPPDASGVLNFRYCVRCEAGGTSSDVVCCEVELNCEPCEIESVNCDVAGDNVVLTWTVSRPDCCVEYKILMDGNEIDAVPGSATSATVPCVPGKHEFCVQCIRPDGTALPIDPTRHCCTVTCICDDEESKIIDLNCDLDLANNAVTLSWGVVDPECCQSFRVTLPGGDFVDVNENSITLDCLPGEFCVQCLRPDGTLGPPECCTVECVCDDQQSAIIDLTCVEDSANNAVTLSWGVVDPECCRSFLITFPDGNTAEVNENPITLDCLPGEYCVQCVRLDGSLGPRECCEVECGGRQRPCDCNQDGLMDISDGVCILSYLFLGKPERLPCAAGIRTDPANITLLDCDGSGILDLTDAIYELGFLFLGGPPPVAGLECITIPDCPDICR